MNLEIRPVDNRKVLKVFIDLPLKLYQGDNHYVFPLRLLQNRLHDTRHNPFYHHAKIQRWILLRNSEPVGRIAAVINQDHLKKYNDATGFFGLYECIDDPEISGVLFETAEAWLKQHGMLRMVGPENLSTNEEVGFLVSGFDSRPVFLLPYNPPFYASHVENYGFTKLLDLYSYLFVYNENLLHKMEKVDDLRKRLESRGITVRQINKSRFEEDIAGLQKVYNSAFEDNWGFLPLSPSEFREYADSLKLITPRELMLVAELDGRIIGFLCNVPDINQVLCRMKNGKLLPTGFYYWLRSKKYIDQVRILILGVDKEFRHHGVDLCLYSMLVQNGRRLGIRTAEAAYIMENNSNMIHILESLDARRIKTYRLYEKMLTA